MKLKIAAFSLMMGLFLVSSVYAAGSTEDQGAGTQGGGMQNGSAQDDNAPVAAVIIMEVQQALDDQGYQAGTPDGKLNSSTQQALRDYQKSKGLPQTGQPDKQTQASLGVNGQSSGKGGGSSNGGDQSGQNPSGGSQQDSGTVPN